MATACKPAEEAPTLETFGHRPEWRDVGQCGMPDCQCRDHEEQLVCARCQTARYRSYWTTCLGADGEEHQVYGSWLLRIEPIAWPCTTAVVLGLAVPETA